jgi:hypothetical protein
MERGFAEIYCGLMPRIIEQEIDWTICTDAGLSDDSAGQTKAGQSQLGGEMLVEPNVTLFSEASPNVEGVSEAPVIL